jgi:hypothetical protein
MFYFIVSTGATRRAPETQREEIKAEDAHENILVYAWVGRFRFKAVVPTSTYCGYVQKLITSPLPPVGHHPRALLLQRQELPLHQYPLCSSFFYVSIEFE